jgi:hypothetical protein
MSGLLFQTSCKSSRPDAESAYSFASEFAEIQGKLGGESLKFAIVNEVKTLPSLTGGVTLKYEVVDPTRATIENAGSFKLLKRGSSPIKVKVTLTKGNDTKTEEMDIPTATGVEVADYYVDLILKLTDSSDKIIPEGSSANRSPVVKGQALKVSDVDSTLSALGLSATTHSGDLDCPNLGDTEIELKVKLTEDGKDASSKKLKTWYLNVVENAAAAAAAEAEAARIAAAAEAEAARIAAAAEAEAARIAAAEADAARKAAEKAAADAAEKAAADAADAAAADAANKTAAEAEAARIAAAAAEAEATKKAWVAEKLQKAFKSYKAKKDAAEAARLAAEADAAEVARIEAAKVKTEEYVQTVEALKLEAKELAIPDEKQKKSLEETMDYFLQKAKNAAKDAETALDDRDLNEAQMAQARADYNAKRVKNFLDAVKENNEAIEEEPKLEDTKVKAEEYVQTVEALKLEAEGLDTLDENQMEKLKKRMDECLEKAKEAVAETETALDDRDLNEAQMAQGQAEHQAEKAKKFLDAAKKGEEAIEEED